MLDNTPNQSSEFQTKHWVKINDESPRTYNKDNQIALKTSILRSSLCDYSNAYILLKGTITVTNTAARGQPNKGANKEVTFKDCRPFTNNFITEMKQL